ncbi:MAG: gephyrin-like molybdotransferase Glp, partial [Chloroflexota bacterium]
DMALQTLAAHLRPLMGTEEIGASAALGRVTTEAIRAPENLPAFPRATMDGYAVQARNTYGASEGLPAYLKVVGEVHMGRAPQVCIGLGEAAKVHTGGMLASGADAVVMVENTQVVDTSTIEVVRPVAPGENTLREGDDIKVGTELFSAGHLLRPQDIGGLMALGIAKLSVFLRPRVSIVSTGDEIVPPEANPEPGQVRDVNTYTLAALSLKAGATPMPQRIVPDNYDELSQAARRGLSEAEILIITAGSSVGTRDMTAQVIASLGKPGILVHGVSLRPGKPTILAVVDGKPVFGLPGNPVSAMVVFGLFVKPSIYAIGGCTHPPVDPVVTARLTRNIASTTGREDYLPVRLKEQDGEIWAEPIFGESNLITIMIRADGLAKVPLDKHGLKAGEIANVKLF